MQSLGGVTLGHCLFVSQAYTETAHHSWYAVLGVGSLLDQ